MSDIKRLGWLEDLLQTKKFRLPCVRFVGIYLVGKVKEKNAFGVFAQYRDHDRLNERYPYADGIYISNESCEGNPLHELCTAAHEVGHFRLMVDGEEYGNSESHAGTYAELFLREFFPKLAKEIYRAHTYGEDPCRLKGVQERAVILAAGSEREQVVGKRILAYLGRSAGIAERIKSLEIRLGRVR